MRRRAVRSARSTFDFFCPSYFFRLACVIFYFPVCPGRLTKSRSGECKLEIPGLCNELLRSDFMSIKLDSAGTKLFSEFPFPTIAYYTNQKHRAPEEGAKGNGNKNDLLFL